VTTLCSKQFKIFVNVEKITEEISYNFEKSVRNNAVVHKLWVMEKFWLHIWIQREKLRQKHNKPFMGQNLVD
jgi:hypothetical protein